MVKSIVSSGTMDFSVLPDNNKAEQREVTVCFSEDCAICARTAI